MKQLKKIIFLLIPILFSLSCNKDTTEIITPTGANPWESQPKSLLDVSGQITDENGNPLADVQISVGGKTLTTDKLGIFVVSQINENPEHLFVKAEKKGFFASSRVIRANVKAKNFIEIHLIAQKEVAKFKSADGANLKLELMTVKLPKNGYIDANGKSYSGTVHVAAKYLDPSKTATQNEMPGSLEAAVNKDGKEQVLATFGMLACELTDDKGQSLNLDGKAEAEITFPIVNDLQATKPQEVPLWYFDNKIGAWREDGMSTRQGNTFVGKVKHFSFWNWDYPYGFVDFEARFLDADGTPLTNLYVFISIKKEGIFNFKSGITDNLGKVSGKIPINEEFVLKFMVKETGQCIGNNTLTNITEFKSADIPVKPWRYKICSFTNIFN